MKYKGIYKILQKRKQSVPGFTYGDRGCWGNNDYTAQLTPLWICAEDRATDMTAWLSADIPAGGDEFSFVFRNTKKLLRVLSHLKGELTVEPFGSENDPQVYLHTSEMAGEFPVLGGYRP